MHTPQTHMDTLTSSPLLANQQTLSLWSCIPCGFSFPERGRPQQNQQEKLNFGSLICDFIQDKNKGVSMNSNKINLKLNNFNNVVINPRNSLPQDSMEAT